MFASAPSSSLFSLGTDDYVNGSTISYIAYCWRRISGYSGFGTYNGNGTSGHSITINDGGSGFAPDFVIIKRINNTDSYSHWYVFDSLRTTGVYSNQLTADGSSLEATGTYVDFTSTGFDLDTTASNLNDSGSKFVYVAFKMN